MIILASTSRTRQDLLRNTGISFTSERPRVDERALALKHPNWLPAEMALRLAEAKAVEVSERHPEALVIGADQVLALDSKIYSKPRDQKDCYDQLMELRGKCHSLISSVVAAREGQALWSHYEEAKLKMRDFSETFLEEYVRQIGIDCTTSVGGYKIESLGIQLFDRVDGDHFTILGMPLLPLLGFLRQSGEIST
jgi:septum formation protein